MAQNTNALMCMCLFTISLTIILIQFAEISSATSYENLGVCYGMLGNNLPSGTDTIALYTQHNIPKLRLFDPNQDALNALAKTNIGVIVGVKNEDISRISSDANTAKTWVQTNVSPYLAKEVKIEYISVGNEVIPGPIANYVAPAMKNLKAALDEANITSIKVTTVVAMTVLQNSYPPSASDFAAEAKDVMKAVLDFLVNQQKEGVLMVNAYPYFAYSSNPSQIKLDYALGNSSNVEVRDGNLNYTNLLDAMIDGVHWATEKSGATNVVVVVSETGWPSAGNGNFTNPELAATYNKNFLGRITSGKGTPKRPNQRFDGHIFAMYNENQKQPGVEQNWGLFYPNRTPVYNIFS